MDAQRLGWQGNCHSAGGMNDRGFTLAEVLIVITLMMIVAAFGSAVFTTSIPMLRANSQATRLATLIQLARANAIKRQRDIELRFDSASNAVRLVRSEAGTETTFGEVTFEYGVALHRVASLGDTPDGFGAAADTDFGTAQRLYFISDGSLVDERNLPVNGTIFLSMGDRPRTARAVTINGTTARPRVYRWMGSTWATQ